MISLYLPTDILRLVPGTRLIAYEAPEGLYLAPEWVPATSMLVRASDGPMEFLRAQKHFSPMGVTQYYRVLDSKQKRTLLLLIPHEDVVLLPERLQRKNDWVRERMKPQPFADR
jgi:hypothetical protein